MLGKGIKRCIIRIEQEIEDLKDMLEEEGIEFEEMPVEERHTRRTDREAIRAKRLNVDGTPDRRFKENREGPTGQGEVKTPERDMRLKENRVRMGAEGEQD